MEVVLVHCNVVNNDYQQDSRVLYTFVPNKTFDQLLNISPTNFIFLKIDQSFKPPEIEHKINIILIIN